MWTVLLGALGSSLVAAKPCPVMEKLSRMAPAKRRLAEADLARAALPRPAAESPVHGDTPADAFHKMNEVLIADAVQTAPCASFDHPSLNAVATVLHKLREADLNAGYVSRGDRRKLHFDSFDYKEALWKAEEHAAKTLASHAPGGERYNATRDGKCAEAVMWYIHHLSEAERARLAQVEAFVLPLLRNEKLLEPVRDHWVGACLRRAKRSVVRPRNSETSSSTTAHCCHASRGAPGCPRWPTQGRELPL